MLDLLWHGRPCARARTRLSWRTCALARRRCLTTIGQEQVTMRTHAHPRSTLATLPMEPRSRTSRTAHHHTARRVTSAPMGTRSAVGRHSQQAIPVRYAPLRVGDTSYGIFHGCYTNLTPRRVGKGARELAQGDRSHEVRSDSRSPTGKSYARRTPPFASPGGTAASSPVLNVRQVGQDDERCA
jgi:hypothetical protein